MFFLAPWRIPRLGVFSESYSEFSSTRVLEFYFICFIRAFIAIKTGFQSAPRAGV